MAVAAQISTERAANLERALESSRDIGVAMGVLMAQHKLSRTQAFDLLRKPRNGSNGSSTKPPDSRSNSTTKQKKPP